MQFRNQFYLTLIEIPMTQMINPDIPGNWGHIVFDDFYYAPEPAGLGVLAMAVLALRRRG